jgi:Kef-type K+ transport system membrane component KefB
VALGASNLKQGEVIVVHPEFWLALSMMCGLAWVMGKGAERIGQTQMIGRMLVGIVFGLVLSVGDVGGFVYTKEVAVIVGILSTIGLTIFQANCGLEINFGHLRGETFRIMVGVLGAGLVCPIVLGSLLGFYLAPSYKPAGVETGVFCAMCGLFLALTSIVAISLTLRPFGLKGGREATICLTAATFEDVIAWVAVGVVLLFVPSTGGHAHSPGEMVLGSLVIVAIAAVVYKLLDRFMSRDANNENTGLIYFTGLAAFAFMSDYIGMHALIGAMLWGGIVPRHNKNAKYVAEKYRNVDVNHGLAHQLEKKYLRVVGPLFVTIFLVKSGLACRWDLSWGDLGAGCLIVVAAIVGKLVSCALAARYSSWDGTRKSYMVSWQSAWVIGTCMNCRGLMTLMLLSVALEAGVIENHLYTLFLLQALITTGMTAWGLHFLKAKELAPPDFHSAPADATVHAPSLNGAPVRIPASVVSPS